MSKNFKNTDFNELIREFKNKNRRNGRIRFENEPQIYKPNDIKNAVVLMKNLIKTQEYDKKLQIKVKEN